ncbi:MAG: hypothetical protein Q7U75_00420, partial [Desulfobacterales bacterium]|nr:hypothetical protein [Desulfobacterales bacterium]
MSIFPGTTVPYSLLGPAPHGKFSAIYLSRGEASGNLASVNAGDNGLYVGGGTINLHFAGILSSPDADAFQAIHAKALIDARAGVNVTTSFPGASPVRLVYVLLASKDSGSGICPAETVFLDIFADGHEPNGEPANCAMVYAVPPCGATLPDGSPDLSRPPAYTSAAAFLAAVEATASNCVRAVATYNNDLIGKYPHLGLKPLQVLRTCLFSGNQFRLAGVSPPEVADAIFKGFAAELAHSPSALKLVEFESARKE